MSDLETIALTEPVPAGPADDDQIAAKPGFGFTGWFGITWLGILFFTLALADVLPFKDPNAEGAIPYLAPGQEGFLLGADSNGRDLLARMVFGGRNSLIIALGSTAGGFLVGGVLGLLSGFYRNWIGRTLAGLFDILLAIPAVVLAVSLVSVMKGDPTSGADRMDPIYILVLALAIVAVPLVARITRGATMAWAQRDFVTAARAQGASNGRILFREILPNVLPAMVYISLLGIAITIVAEGSLAILGASLDPPDTTWGILILEGKSKMEDAPYLLFIPIAAVFLTVLSLNFLGDAVRNRFDVRESAL